MTLALDDVKWQTLRWMVEQKTDLPTPFGGDAGFGKMIIMAALLLSNVHDDVTVSEHLSLQARDPANDQPRLGIYDITTSSGANDARESLKKDVRLRKVLSGGASSSKETGQASLADPRCTNSKPCAHCTPSTSGS
ncbi:MAG: hypothetical protein SGPRY_009385 [Prymnesium sp.]